MRAFSKVQRHLPGPVTTLAPSNTAHASLSSPQPPRLLACLPACRSADLLLQTRCLPGWHSCHRHVSPPCQQCTASCSSAGRGERQWRCGDWCAPKNVGSLLKHKWWMDGNLICTHWCWCLPPLQTAVKTADLAARPAPNLSRTHLGIKQLAVRDGLHAVKASKGIQHAARRRHSVPAAHAGHAARQHLPAAGRGHAGRLKTQV